MLSVIGTTLLSFVTGRAAKAGAAALAGMIGAPGAIAGVEYVTNSDAGMTLLGFVIAGAAQGIINWCAVYFKANEGAFPDAPRGLY